MRGVDNFKFRPHYVKMTTGENDWFAYKKQRILPYFLDNNYIRT